MKVLVLLGQLKHSRIDNGQATILGRELARGGTLYTKYVYFNMFIDLPSILLHILPVWLLVKHIDDFKDVNECDAIVVSGKKMIRYAKHLRKLAFPDARIIQVGAPGCRIGSKDILLRQLSGLSVVPHKLKIKINGLICEKIDSKIAKQECERFKKIKSYLKGEFIGVFISGKSLMFDINSDDAVLFAEAISNVSNTMKMPLLVFADKNVNTKIIQLIKKNLDCSYYFYSKRDNPDENPKVAFMSWSSYYVLIGSAVNDHSEYLSQEKPAYVFLCRNCTRKYFSFIDCAIANGTCRVLPTGSANLEYFKPTQLNNVPDIVKTIKEMM